MKISLAAGALGALLGCAPAPVVAPAPRPIASAAASHSLGFGGIVGEFRSVRFGLRLPLPDGKAWRIDDRKTPWLTAVHPATGSTVIVRRWYEEDLVNRARCEARARASRSLPVREGSDLLERRALDVPPEFDTQLEVRVVASPEDGDSVRAFALAFGGWAHACFAYVFTTTASGPGAETALGDRLAVMIQSSLMDIKVEDPLHPFVRGRVPLLPDEGPGAP